MHSSLSKRTFRFQCCKFPSSLKTLPRYVHVCTCLIWATPNSNLQLGQLILLTIIHFVFLHLMHSPFFTFSVNNLNINSCSFPFRICYRHRVICISMLLRLCSAMHHPGRASNTIRIVPHPRLNKSVEKTNLTPLYVFVYRLNSFVIRMQSVCYQYRLLNILISFPNMSRLLSNSNRSLWRAF